MLDRPAEGVVLAQALGERDLGEAAVVPVDQLAQSAQALKLGRSEMLSGGRRKEALLADAMEAVLAAVYLDAGWEAARALILRLWESRLAVVEADARDGRISYNSPLGRALIGRQVGEDVEVSTPSGDRYYQIKKVEFI